MPTSAHQGVTELDASINLCEFKFSQQRQQEKVRNALKEMCVFSRMGLMTKPPDEKNYFFYQAQSIDELTSVERAEAARERMTTQAVGRKLTTAAERRDCG